MVLKYGLGSGPKSNLKRTIHGGPYFGSRGDDYYRRALFRVEPHTACVAGVVYSFGVSATPCITRLPHAGALSRY
jgi:hypothetical protein